jgi:hypothetical protein
MDTPTRITELSNGLEATYADGAVVKLTIDGATRCTVCHDAQCEHARAAYPAYIARKWRLAEHNRECWGRVIYHSLNIDPRIFFPPEQLFEATDEPPRLGPVAVFPPMDVRGGQLYGFPDGAYLAVLSEHPDGGTQCSLCHSRECRHWATVRELSAELTPGGDGVNCVERTRPRWVT